MSTDVSSDIIVVERELQAIEDALDGAAKVLDNLREEKVIMDEEDFDRAIAFYTSRHGVFTTRPMQAKLESMLIDSKNELLDELMEVKCVEIELLLQRHEFYKGLEPHTRIREDLQVEHLLNIDIPRDERVRILLASIDRISRKISQLENTSRSQDSFIRSPFLTSASPHQPHRLRVALKRSASLPQKKMGDVLRQAKEPSRPSPTLLVPARPAPPPPNSIAPPPPSSCLTGRTRSQFRSFSESSIVVSSILGGEKVERSPSKLK